ncbi:MAG: DNA polymerase Y family protein [Deltaproteobacteria bacterium]|nr:DNA polymerase Y family protein [Deltaproteobacteria bacterium]
MVAAGKGTRELVVVPSVGARSAGIRPGMALSAAHALARGLSVFQRDEVSEAAALARLAAWAGRFTPVVSLAPPREVVLEVAGSLRLFRGMENLVGKVEEGIRDLGYTAQVALAPTPLGAALLARARPGARVTGMERLTPELFAVPLDALDFPPDTLEALRGLGVGCLGDCLKLPRPGLDRRFGGELPRYLDRALGRHPDPRNPFVLPPRFEGRLPLLTEVSAAEPLLFAVRRLLLELEGYLEARGGGAGELRLTLSHREGRRTRIEVGLLSPSRDTGRLLGLLRERLCRTRIPEPVSAVGLSVETVLPLAPANRELWKEPARQVSEAWPELLERLRARLGDAAVQGLRPAAEHRPERAFVLMEPERGDEPILPSLRFGRRPLWLLPRPAPLERKELTLLTGPERIEAGWWDGEDVRRDYFVAEDSRGARLWIFRERGGKRGWYLHGIFG